ncbi:lipocalin family protein [Variovorax sp. OV329]|uniref:lipocalin family protein n=1 Tax=Variovorax sp. OV329 TaxID=1882825 RepID=UPI0015872B42|nr:lipocalin family protein [Variovorax sp. OV329]
MLILASIAALVACANLRESDRKPVALVPQVDLPRFMGDWYVIASIPTFIERGAHNAMENYQLDAEGTISTTFTFNADAPEGPVKTYRSRGFVLDTVSNAIWGQQYFWPVKADYRISFLSRDYQRTVVTREKRDYVWIMARTPTISEAELTELTAFVASQGYEPAKLNRVPQRVR